ncbi:hypothetical protein FANTH_8070 [Fusarium anthophilum]|uniref:Uncharacterized protein n=1 Tax=Fusarium anthophilum TaxID=48485 RepID=A0A8H4ZC48_9HYPO|nr:hypothetical protein FANTH_8070 [Fusarium anthophilum]
MVKLRLTSASSTKQKATPSSSAPNNGQVDPPFRLGLRFRPHDGSYGVQVLTTTRPSPATLSNRIQERDFVKLSNAPVKVPIHQRDLPAIHAARHADRLFDGIVAAFKEVEQTMALELAVKLKQAVMQTLETTSTKGRLSKTRVITLMPYQRLAGIHGIKKQLAYSDWFFMAVWLGPEHPFLEDIRKDMSDHWGVHLLTDEIIYPVIHNRETEERLFNGEVTPSEASIEERAKAIKKTIEDSTVKGLSATIKGHLPDGLKLNGFGDSTRIQTLETSLTSTNRELEDARKQVRNLESQLTEAKASQARAQEKTNSDMETLRKEVQLLKAAQNDTVNKTVEALWPIITQSSTSCRQRMSSIEAKVRKGEKKVEKDIDTLRNEVAQSAEKAEKAVETGALVLSVLSTPGGQKRKMDEFLEDLDI